MPTIMVVEDNELSRDALSRRLERRGYASCSPSTDSRRRRARAHRAARHHPDGSRPAGHRRLGSDRQLKADPGTQHIPIIVLSAHAMTNDRDQALPAGGDDFDTKPIRFQSLLEKIEALLARAATATA